jgi:hypothetical protein
MSDNRAQLQELYHHLDGVEPGGNQRLAWYAQNRALEYSHAEALEETIKHFRLRDQDWYQLRMSRSDT